MKRLLPITIALLPLLLTACEEQSDTYPADGRDFNAQAYIEGKPYTGRVIDDYMKNAWVWLDMDGDGQYTPGPLTLENDSGTELVLDNGEPTAMTVENGVFSLDVSELEQDLLVSPDLDPRDYPLFAMALPGHTESGGQVLNQAFMLSAPAGVRNITPLTTLVYQRPVRSTTDIGRALGNINLSSDYVRSGDVRAQAYARAFARFLASQLPRDYEGRLGNLASQLPQDFEGLLQGFEDLLDDGDGLSAEAVKLMGISFARNALSIVRIVDEEAALRGDYAAVDVGNLDLPEVDLELNDSVLISGQTVFARAESDSSTSSAGLEIRAKLAFNYAESARLTSVEANGCMVPSLIEMVRVINADGKIAATGTQWVPTVSLSPKSGTFYDEAGIIDERLTFDWKEGTDKDSATFETTTTCHDDLAASSELGGPAAIEYTWELGSNGKVTSLTATSESKTSDRTTTEVLTPDYTNSSDFFIGFTRTHTVNDVEEEVEVIDLLSGPQSCLDSVADVDKTKPHVVSAIHPFTVSGTLPIPAGFTNLGLELDTRELEGIRLNRPLRYGFQNQEFLDTLNQDASNSDGFEWKFYYPTVTSGQIVADQPNLIRTAYLGSYSGDRECGRDFGTIPLSSFTQVDAYARVEYSYQRLSEYLAGQIQ